MSSPDSFLSSQDFEIPLELHDDRTEASSRVPVEISDSASKIENKRISTTKRTRSSPLKVKKKRAKSVSNVSLISAEKSLGYRYDHRYRDGAPCGECRRGTFEETSDEYKFRREDACSDEGYHRGCNHNERCGYDRQDFLVGHDYLREPRSPGYSDYFSPAKGDGMSVTNQGSRDVIPHDAGQNQRPDQDDEDQDSSCSSPEGEAVSSVRDFQPIDYTSAPKNAYYQQLSNGIASAMNVVVPTSSPLVNPPGIRGMYLHPNSSSKCLRNQKVTLSKDVISLYTLRFRDPMIERLFLEFYWRTQRFWLLIVIPLTGLYLFFSYVLFILEKGNGGLEQLDVRHEFDEHSREKNLVADNNLDSDVEHRKTVLAWHLLWLFMFASLLCVDFLVQRYVASNCGSCRLGKANSSSSSNGYTNTGGPVNTSFNSGSVGITDSNNSRDQRNFLLNTGNGMNKDGAMNNGHGTVGVKNGNNDAVGGASGKTGGTSFTWPGIFNKSRPSPADTAAPAITAGPNGTIHAGCQPQLIGDSSRTDDDNQGNGDPALNRRLSEGRHSQLSAGSPIYGHSPILPPRVRSTDSIGKLFGRDQCVGSVAIGKASGGFSGEEIGLSSVFLDRDTANDDSRLPSASWSQNRSNLYREGTHNAMSFGTQNSDDLSSNPSVRLRPTSSEPLNLSVNESVISEWKEHESGSGSGSGTGSAALLHIGNMISSDGFSVGYNARSLKRRNSNTSSRANSGSQIEQILAEIHDTSLNEVSFYTLDNQQVDSNNNLLINSKSNLLHNEDRRPGSNWESQHHGAVAQGKDYDSCCRNSNSSARAFYGVENPDVQPFFTDGAHSRNCSYESAHSGGGRSVAGHHGTSKGSSHEMSDGPCVIQKTPESSKGKLNLSGMSENMSTAQNGRSLGTKSKGSIESTSLIALADSWSYYRQWWIFCAMFLDLFISSFVNPQVTKFFLLLYVLLLRVPLPQVVLLVGVASVSLLAASEGGIMEFWTIVAICGASSRQIELSGRLALYRICCLNQLNYAACDGINQMNLESAQIQDRSKGSNNSNGNGGNGNSAITNAKRGNGGNVCTSSVNCEKNNINSINSDCAAVTEGSHNAVVQSNGGGVSSRNTVRSSDSQFTPCNSKNSAISSNRNPVLLQESDFSKFDFQAFTKTEEIMQSILIVLSELVGLNTKGDQISGILRNSPNNRSRNRTQREDAEMRIDLDEGFATAGSSDDARARAFKASPNNISSRRQNPNDVRQSRTSAQSGGSENRGASGDFSNRFPSEKEASGVSIDRRNPPERQASGVSVGSASEDLGRNNASRLTRDRSSPHMRICRTPRKTHSLRSSPPNRPWIDPTLDFKTTDIPLGVRHIDTEYFENLQTIMTRGIPWVSGFDNHIVRESIWEDIPRMNGVFDKNFIFSLGMFHALPWNKDIDPSPTNGNASTGFANISTNISRNISSKDVFVNDPKIKSLIKSMTKSKESGRYESFLCDSVMEKSPWRSVIGHGITAAGISAKEMQQMLMDRKLYCAYDSRCSSCTSVETSPYKGYEVKYGIFPGLAMISHRGFLVLSTAWVYDVVNQSLSEATRHGSTCTDESAKQRVYIVMSKTVLPTAKDNIPEKHVLGCLACSCWLLRDIDTSSDKPGVEVTLISNINPKGGVGENRLAAMVVGRAAQVEILGMLKGAEETTRKGSL